jgi:hypothetical protein
MIRKPSTFQPKPFAAVLLTLTGISVGLLISLLAVWADYESTSYGFMKRANSPLRGLSCPVFLGRNETGNVSIKVSNTTDQPLSPSVRTEISTGQDPESRLDFVQLAPGEHAIVQRTVGNGNIVFGRFIFVNASVFSIYPLPNRENTCGIFVLPFAGGGSLVLILGTTLSVLCMSLGAFFFYKANVRRGRSHALLFMVIATMLALAFGFMGSWVQALILIIMVILTFLISSGSIFQ